MEQASETFQLFQAKFFINVLAEPAEVVRGFVFLYSVKVMMWRQPFEFLLFEF